MIDLQKCFELIINIGLPHCLLLSAALFSIGLFGLLTRRSIISVLMCIELMLNAVNINLVAFNRFSAMPDHSGQLMAIFGIVVAAAEVAIGMALAVKLYQERNTVNVDELDELRG